MTTIKARILYAAFWFLVFVCIGAMAIKCQAQVNVVLEWDASANETDGTQAINPIQYRLHGCTDLPIFGSPGVDPLPDPGAYGCSSLDAGQNKSTELAGLNIILDHGSLTYFAVLAWRYEMVSQDGGTVELGTVKVYSGPSNILQVRAFSPPGNPGNQRIRIAEVGDIFRENTIKLWAKIKAESGGRYGEVAIPIPN